MSINGHPNVLLFHHRLRLNPRAYDTNGSPSYRSKRTTGSARPSIGATSQDRAGNAGGSDAPAVAFETNAVPIHYSGHNRA